MLDDLAREAQVAFLVEMEHAVHERHDFRLLLLRYLASHGWRIVGEELDWATGERIDSYLRTGDESWLEPVDNGRWFETGMFATPADPAMQTAMHDARVRAARALRRIVPDARWFGFDSGREDEEYVRRGNAATSLEDAVALMAYREELMHERVARVMRDHPGEKLVLCAASTHLAKDDDAITSGLLPRDPARSVGHHVAHELTDRPVLSVWLVHGGGSTPSPYASTDDLSAPVGTVEAGLAEQWDRPCLVRVDADTEVRRFAGMYGAGITCRPADQVDALVFCPRVTPVTRPTT